MALAVPTASDRVATSRALGLASLWGSGVLLVATVVFVVGFKVEVPQVNIALALAGLGVAGLTVAWSLMVSNPWVVLGLLLTAGVGIFVFTLQIRSGLVEDGATDDVIFTAPKIALAVAGVAGRTLPAALARSTVAFWFATIAVDLGTLSTGHGVTVDAPALVVWLSIETALLAIWYGRVQSLKNMTSRRASIELEQRRSERSRLSAVASATVYDSVLNDLHALAVSSSGELTESHRAFLAKDIASLAHPGLLVDEVMSAGRASTSGIEESGIGSVVRSARKRGLTVTVSGEPARLADLDPQVRGALVGAIGEVLAGVSAYAGVRAADVSVAQGRQSVTVMISDAGIGFDPLELETELPGTTFSVRDCLEQVNGTARIWSAPGRGMAVFLSVPNPRTSGIGVTA